MSSTSAEWLEQQADRLSGHHRAAVDAAKIVATFATAIAATLVGTTFQVSPTTTSDRWSASLLAMSTFLAVLVALADRLVLPDHARLFVLANSYGWSEDELLTELRVALLAASDANDTVVKLVRQVLLVQLLATAAAGSTALVSLWA